MTDYWITTKARETDTVHSDKACQYLNQAHAVRPATEHEVKQNALCARCTGDVPQGPTDLTYYQAAVEAGQDD